MKNDPPVKRYKVSRSRSRTRSWHLGVAMLGMGTAVFAGMVDHRSDQADAALALPALAISSMGAPAEPIRRKAEPVAAPFVLRPVATNFAQALGSTTYSNPLRLEQRPSLPAGGNDRAAIGGTTLLLDLFTGRGNRTSPAANLAQDQGPLEAAASGQRSASGNDPTGDAIAAAGSPPVPESPAGAREGSSNERFAGRVSNKQEDAAQARQMTGLDRLVPQGAILGAVMETALNSDLPGYARAVVTKDVLSFDGSAVLIPAGSRVIGEYNSGVAQGASRIFIVWSRLIRPDGVTISLGSPAVDELGRGGLGGKVNRHFLQRFGSAILLSVLTGGINAASASVGRGSTVIVGTSNEASALATQALQGSDIPPTIKTKQGALVRVFVARDLDFSTVGPVG